MKKVKHSELKELIKISYKKKIPLYIWGATGIGKSETVRQAASEIAAEQKLKFTESVNGPESFCLVDVRLSQLDPSDLRGLPTIKEDRTTWVCPDWLPREGQGIIFFDEINLAPPLVQASAYQLILDRKLGSYRLPEGWTVIAAGNRLEDKANIFELASPLSNRFIHVELVTDIESWTNWAINSGVDPRIITFLNFKPSLLHKFDSKVNEKAFPTPRSWAKYCSPLISEISSETEELLHTLIASAVGEGAATEMLAYLKLSKHIDVRKLLEEPEKIKEIKSVDMKFTVVSTIAEIVRSDKKLLEKAIKCCPYLDPEFAILLLRLLKAQDSQAFTKSVSKQEIAGVLKQYIKYLID